MIHFAFVFVLNQVSYYFVHEAFALMFVTDGHAAQSVAETASGCYDVVVVVVDRAGVIKILVSPYALVQQEFLNL